MTPPTDPPARTRRVTTRNASFQQWQALLENRNKRQRLGQFLIQGVRPLNLAVARGWPLSALLRSSDRKSEWAAEIAATAGAEQVYELSPALMAELGQKDEQVPEVLAVGSVPADDLSRIPAGEDLLVAVLDRPSSPGNLGTLIRSADALGASGVVITGHAADLYDPKAVRASTGSIFALPAVRAASPEPVAEWIEGMRSGGVAARVVGTSERAESELAGHDLRGPTALVIGNETSGLSGSWANRCDELARIPMTGSASSFNAACSGSIALYEARRQRG